MKILVVDDDLELSRLIAFTLRGSRLSRGRGAGRSERARAFGLERPDLVLLDVNLPRIGGFEVLKRIRADGSRVPVLMLTVRSTGEDQCQGLDLGADDYLTKPFSPRTLLARPGAPAPRGVEQPAALASGDLARRGRQTISVRSGAPVRLTPLEFRLAQLLLANAGRTLSPIGSPSTCGNRGMGIASSSSSSSTGCAGRSEDPASPRCVLTVSGVGYLLRV
jgi:DNA-binding response OmpR family regulator